MGAEGEPAWRVLPSGARAVLAAIEGELGEQGMARLSRARLVSLGIGPGQVTDAVKRLSQLGFVIVERGSFGSPPSANGFRLSDRYRSITSEVEARRLVYVSRKPRTRRQQQADAAAKRAARRNHADDIVARRLQEGVRARPER